MVSSQLHAVSRGGSDTTSVRPTRSLLARTFGVVTRLERIMTTSRATSRPTAGGEPDFPAWLAGLPDDALVRVCELRPDVATPPPASLDVLASRLRLPASTARAMGSLSWPELLVLATAAALGADSGAVPLSAVADRLGVDAEKKPRTDPAPDDDDNNNGSPFHAAVNRLRELALVWGEPEHVRIVPVTASAIAAAPVVAPHPGEPTGAELDEAWAGLSAPAVGVLEAIARGRTPVGALGPGRRSRRGGGRPPAGRTPAGPSPPAAAPVAHRRVERIRGVRRPRAHALDRARR